MFIPTRRFQSAYMSLLWQQLSNHHGGHFLCACSSGSLFREVSMVPPSIRYFVVPGERAATKRGLLSAMASQLCFPPYFGSNWDALYDCLCDLSWVKARDIVIVFHNADLILRRKPTEWECFGEVIREAVAAWTQATADVERPPRRGFVVWHCIPDRQQMLRSRLSPVGIDATLIQCAAPEA